VVHRRLHRALQSRRHARSGAPFAYVCVCALIDQNQIYFTYRAWIISARSWLAFVPWSVEVFRIAGVILTSTIYLAHSHSLDEFRHQHGWTISTALVTCVAVSRALYSTTRVLTVLAG
jgi:hypothetical protein